MSKKKLEPEIEAMVDRVLAEDIAARPEKYLGRLWNTGHLQYMEHKRSAVRGLLLLALGRKA